MDMRNRGNRSTGVAGVIEVRGILGGVVADLGARVVGGEWAEGAVMPKEADLIEEMGVSRSVIREAQRILGAKGLIRSRTSDGTRIQPRTEWRLLDPDLIDWRIQAGDTRSLLQDLLKVRLALEPGVVFVATQTASAAARKRVSAAWQRKLAVESDTTMTPEERREQFIETDLEFHREFLAVVGSEILNQLFSVIQTALALIIDLQMRARGADLTLAGLEESTELHRAVYDAFMRGDAMAAELAMRTLIDTAIMDANEGLALLDRAPFDSNATG